MKGTQGLSHLGLGPGLPQLLCARGASLDEAGHDARRVVQHRDHARGDAQLGRPLVGVAFGVAVDAELFGVLAGHPHDVVGAAEVHLEIAVGDAAVERRHLSLARAEQRRQPCDDLAQLRHLLAFVLRVF